MPIFVRRDVAPGSAPPPSGPTSPPILDTSDRRRPSATYIDPTGVEWPLASPELGWFTFDEVSGLGPPDRDLVTDPHPRGGSRIRHINVPSRVINWPLKVWGDSYLQLRDRWRALSRAFTMTRKRGPGWLRIEMPDGSSRQIAVVLQSGFRGEPGEGLTDDFTVLVLFCEDPFFRASEPITVTRDFSAGTADPFLSPFASFATGQDFGATTIFNPGEVEAWPTLVLTGPAAGLTATNVTTGETYTLTYALTAGQTITVTSDPMTVRGPIGQVLTFALTWPGAEPWALEEGLNDITFTVASPLAGAQVSLTYFPRYEGA